MLGIIGTILGTLILVISAVSVVQEYRVLRRERANLRARREQYRREAIEYFAQKSEPVPDTVPEEWTK